MGKEIVYCGKCGSSLSEGDFSEGRASYVDLQPYCKACRPVPVASESPRRGTDRIPLAPTHESPRKAIERTGSGSSTRRKTTTTTRIPIVSPPSTRRSARRPASPALFLYAAGGVAVLLVIVVLAASTGSPARTKAPKKPSEASLPAPPPAAPKPAPRPEPPPRRATPAPVAAAKDPAKVLENLEIAVGNERNPDAVLLLCDQARAALKGTPHEARLKEIEQRALTAKREGSTRTQLARTLSEVDRLRKSDPEFERQKEVFSMLTSALEIAGLRRPEVEKLIAEYRKEVADAAKAAPPAPKAAPAPKPAPAPPKEVDESLKIENFTLVSAPDGKPIPGFDPIPDGCTIDLARLPTRKLSVRANLAPGVKAGSVRFHFSAGGRQQVEDQAPYYLLGNDRTKVKAWKAEPGSFRVSARPFTKPKARGTQGKAKVVSFTVK